MDTPERGQQHGGAAISRVEDSPVFNYISSLSPIKPVKSVHITQTFHSWNFSSIPSVFASPHLNTQKECRFSIRYPVLDLPTSELASENGDDKSHSSGVSNLVKLSECIIDVQENCNTKCSLNEATVDPPEEGPTLPVKLPRSVQHYCGSPNHNTSPCYGSKIDLKRVKGSLVDFIGGDQEEQKCSPNEIEMESIHHQGQSKEEVSAPDWENLIADDNANVFIFDASTELEADEEDCQKIRDRDSNYFTSSLSNIPEDNIDDTQEGQPTGILGTCLQNPMLELHGVHGQEVGEQADSEHTPQVPPTCLNKPEIDGEIEKMDEEAGHCYQLGGQVNYQHRRVFRRRSLVFEVAGSNMLCDSKDNCSCSFPIDIKSTPGGKQQVSTKPGLGPRPHVLPSIGLHLNSLATTSKERILTEENLASGRQLMSISCSTGTFASLSALQNPTSSSLVAENTTCDGMEVQDLPAMTNSFHAPAAESEELNHSSEKKKKCKPENGENESCKRCNCKKSKCLKLYCECFAAGVYCVEPCACQGCLNKPIHEDTVLATRKQIESRNPLAFAPKVIRTSVPAAEIGEDTNKTPASARHKRGCNCKKSSCLKKYCECYQGGVGCSISCRCEGCKNTFGTRDGILLIGNEEIEHEDEQFDVCEKDVDKQTEIQRDHDVQKDEKHFLDDALPISALPISALPSSPSFKICRPSAGIPFFSNGKPPRSSVMTIGSSPLLNSCHTLKKPGITKSRFEKHFQIVPEDETPEILRGTTSPINGVKTASPNRKRVSPPHHDMGLSPSRKCGRKLILKSIPSFPSLTGDAISELPVNYTKPSLNS